MDGEAGCWATSGKIRTPPPPLARVKGVGRQQQLKIVSYRPPHSHSNGHKSKHASHNRYAPFVTFTYTTHIISSTTTTYAPHYHLWICGRRSDGNAGKMDGEASWWTTSRKIELSTLARVKGVGTQHQYLNRIPIKQAVYCQVKQTCKLLSTHPSKPFPQRVYGS